MNVAIGVENLVLVALGGQLALKFQNPVHIPQVEGDHFSLTDQSYQIPPPADCIRTNGVTGASRRRLDEFGLQTAPSLDSAEGGNRRLGPESLLVFHFPLNLGGRHQRSPCPIRADGQGSRDPPLDVTNRTPIAY